MKDISGKNNPKKLKNDIIMQITSLNENMNHESIICHEERKNSGKKLHGSQCPLEDFTSPGKLMVKNLCPQMSLNI